MGIYDNILNGTFSSLGVPRQPTMQPGMLGRGLPTDRLAPGTAGLPNPSPGSGMTAQQLQGLGGYSVDPLTGKLAYSPPTTPTAAQSNPALAAATSAGAPTAASPTVNSVSGTMQPQNGLLALLTGGTGGGLMEQIMGPSKNGLGGLAGLLGGPQQGGLLQQLFGGGNGSVQPRTAPAPSYVTRSGALMPLTTMGGGTRRTDADSDGFSGVASEKNSRPATAQVSSGSARKY
jgi:hypothetical protein